MDSRRFISRFCASATMLLSACNLQITEQLPRQLTLSTALPSPAPTVQNNFYSCHVMIAFSTHTSNLTAWVKSMKDAGYNHIWAHMDSYSESYYHTGLQGLLNAAQTVGGITVSPGLAGYAMPAADAAQVILDTYQHPAVTRFNGKLVYAIYGHNSTQFKSVVSLLTTAGIPRTSYLVLTNTLYPTANGSGGWNEYASSTTSDVNAVRHLYDIDSNIDGLINFGVDKGTSNSSVALTRLIQENATLAQVGQTRGKLTMAAINSSYASVQFTDFGFSGTASIWQSILDAAVKPAFVGDMTANDYVELSYMSPLENPDANGVSYIPELAKGYVLGLTVRTPMLDHSGVQKFLQPWIQAYRTGAAAPKFTQDRMFAWYYLHPANALTMSTIPSAVAALSPMFTQTWWNGTIYATGTDPVGGMNQIVQVKANLISSFGKIRMAAHLTSPAQLQINGTLSAVFPAGPAYFEVAQTLGTPTFAIVRNGVAAQSGSGEQAITNSVWPGGWNYLATDIPAQ